MPNSGTNVLFHLLSDNCEMKEGEEVQWQAPWGKHEFLHQAGTDDEHPPKDENIMVIAVIKDPLQWMASMCRQPYIRPPWIRLTGETCPSPIQETSITQPGWTHGNFLEVWMQWHSEYLENDASQNHQPALHIRFEDLLFQPETTITNVCGCLGLETKKGRDFRILESVPKSGPWDTDRNRTQTMAQYIEKRTAILSLLTREDREYMHKFFKHENSSEIISRFSYDISDMV